MKSNKTKDRAAAGAKSPGTLPAVKKGKPEARKLPDVTGDPEFQQRRIAEAAFRIAERAGFPPGQELDHWLQAEAEIKVSAAKRAK